MDSQLLLLMVCAYGGLLFAVAWLAERYSHFLTQSWWRPLVYTLSIGVYCSSWTFLGAVGTAVDNGWHFLPIYLGPILVVTLGWPFVRRLLIVSSRNKVTSIADFIGSRYGKSQTLAATVTVILVVGTLPYIALQLKGVGIAWESIDWRNENPLGFDAAASLICAMVMAWFAILFGTRIIDGPHKLRGMITAIASESFVKLIAFVAIAVVAIYVLQKQGAGLPDAGLNMQASQLFSPRFLTEMFLAAAAIICLPRQFHVMVVEYQHRNDLRFTRWMLPLYLAIFAVLVIPIAQAGVQLFSAHGASPDSYMMVLSQWTNSEALVALTFIGAVSAATGMVVVATIALSIMISNELVVPLWLRFSSSQGHSAAGLGKSLRLIRRLSIVAVLLFGWLLQQLMNQVEGLASLGLISFAASAQLLPAILAALYWPRAHARGVMAGVVAGMALWTYCLLLPAILGETHTLVANGLWGISWLSPWNLFGMGWLDPLSHGVFCSLLVNLSALVWMSGKSHFSSLDLRQAVAFTRLLRSVGGQRFDMEPSGIEVRQLQSLMEPLFGEERTQEIWHDFEQKVGHRLLPHDQAPKFAVQSVENNMASIIGAVSAHKATELLLKRTPLELQDFVSLVGGSSRQIQFSQTLLQTTLETVPQGICVVDNDLRLVAWNQQYQLLFDYPRRLLYVGCEIAKIYYFNAERGYFSAGEEGDIDKAIAKRLQKMRTAESHRYVRTLPTGTVLEIRGTPLPNGGYVMTYTDVTDYHAIVDQLEKSRDLLEVRVESRTSQLKDVNQSLQRENFLRSRVEQELKDAHASKSRFLAAASHDLLQPVNAARLFLSSLEGKVKESSDQPLYDDVENLDAALTSAEQLISSLREISRLSSGKEAPRRENFSLSSLLQPLAQEASILASKKELGFSWVDSSSWVYSDPQLLRRVIQNFISNALHYTQSGKVLLGCRRHRGLMLIEVWDTGPGIDDTDRERIFEEFERIPGTSGSSQGLGLGLSIARNISQLLGHHISLSSVSGKGSVFRIAVPLGEKQQQEQSTVVTVDPRLEGLNILCIDNEPAILAGMQSLLQQWGCNVVTALDLKQSLSQWQLSEKPDLILADFHLDGETGLDVLEALGYHWQQELSAIVISADNSDEVVERVQKAGFKYLSKPVLPASLRNMMRRAVRQKFQ